MTGPVPTGASPTVAFDAEWNGAGFHGRTVYAVENETLRPIGDEGSGIRADHELGGTLIPHLTDHHTHLGLTDPAELFAHGITDAVDLGWIPEVSAGWLIDRPGHPAVRIAGALITAPGGYPKRSGWAPKGSAAEVSDPAEAIEAVRVQLIRGASRIKVALNTDAGPTMDDATLRAIVDTAHSARTPVVVHAQGRGQAARALEAGVDQFAHAPFSERLGDDTIAASAAAGMTWVSTLDIHGWGVPTREFAVAVANVRRFAAAGGRILYGTDLGNGPLRIGVNERELGALVTAGLDSVRLLQALAGDSSEQVIGHRFGWVPTPPPPRTADLPAWLASARGHTTTTIHGVHS